jgi:hypothetical protein
MKNLTATGMETFHRMLLRALTALTCSTALGVTSPALAYPGGVSTFNLGPQGCNACHTGGDTPSVSLIGPTTVAPNSANTYTLMITATGTQTFGGFNVTASFGTLTLGGANASRTQVIPGANGINDVTHTSPKPASGGSISFSFVWTAPGSFTSATLNAWGNAVNGNASPTGDHATFVSVTVMSSMPGPNPTTTPTPTPLPTATPILHDVVVGALKPLNLKVAPGNTQVAKNLRVKVTNADAKGSIGYIATLIVANGCPPGVDVGAPTFSGQSKSVFLKPGQSRAATVPVVVTSDAFAPLNHIAPSRCRLTFVATSLIASLDPNPSNNMVTAEINVTDGNDPDQATTDESFIRSLAPLKLKLARGAASAAKTIKTKVGNADILPVAEKPGDLIGVVVSEGDCPAGTVSTAAPETVTVAGGKKQKSALTVTADAAAFTSAGAKSPARCTAEVTTTGPTDPDADPTNNTTKLVIDVFDRNDF